MPDEPADASRDFTIVAIDGPAGSGKSTVGRALAARLGLEYLDTGAMYRGITFAALRRNIDPFDQDVVARLAPQVELELEDGRVIVDGVDATIEIRGPEVTRAVSVVAANPQVRTELVRRQREWADAHHGGVMEGRDIGSVVFPDADLKVFLVCAPEERARRRLREQGVDAPEHQEVARETERLTGRDEADQSRPTAPLVRAPDAVLVDTTDLTFEEQVSSILRLVERRIGR